MRSWRCLFGAAVLMALASLAGCGHDAESPAAPDPTPAEADQVAAALSFRQISVGWGSDHGHVCGVATDDRAYCWGLNQTGQLGLGSNLGPEACGLLPCSRRPALVHGGLRFSMVSAGGGHTCGITTDHRAWCWGLNDLGQLGDGTRQMRLLPVRVLIDRRFRFITAGAGHTCAITDVDVAFCWGGNYEGELGAGSLAPAHELPVRVAGGLRWRNLSAGSTHSCGTTTSERAYCWGFNSAGKLGDGSPSVTSRLVPSAVAGNHAFRQISAGFTHTCAITTDDRAWCWGEQAVGDGTYKTRSTPVLVYGDRRYRQVSAGFFNSCAVTRVGLGFCWGSNGYPGVFGNGTIGPSSKPVAIGGSHTWLQVRTQYQVTCGVADDHHAWCWGSNTAGQLGNGSRTDSSVPVAVGSP